MAVSWVIQILEGSMKEFRHSVISPAEKGRTKSFKLSFSPELRINRRNSTSPIHLLIQSLVNRIGHFHRKKPSKIPVIIGQS